MSRESLLAAARPCLWLLVCMSAGCILTGCSDRVRRPSVEEMAVFKADEATGPAVDMDRVLQAKIVTGPYRTGTGDVVQLEMPAILTSQSFDGTVTDGKKENLCLPDQRRRDNHASRGRPVCGGGQIPGGDRGGSARPISSEIYQGPVSDLRECPAVQYAACFRRWGGRPAGRLLATARPDVTRGLADGGGRHRGAGRSPHPDRPARGRRLAGFRNAGPGSPGKRGWPAGDPSGAGNAPGSSRTRHWERDPPGCIRTGGASQDHGLACHCRSE